MKSGRARRLATVFLLLLVVMSPLRSAAASGHWVTTGPDGGLVNAIIPSPLFAQDRTVFAGTGNGIFVSRDGGASWATTPSELSSWSVWSLAITPDYATSRTLYAGTDEGGIYVSHDAGGTWADTSGEFGDAAVYWLAPSPQYAADGTIFAATDYRVLRSRGASMAYSSTTPMQGTVCSRIIS